jgi:hypothetical protein
MSTEQKCGETEKAGGWDDDPSYRLVIGGKIDRNARAECDRHPGQ